MSFLDLRGSATLNDRNIAFSIRDDFERDGKTPRLHHERAKKNFEN